MVCATPSSVMMKSFAVSPSMGLPLLSLTETVSTTSCVVEVNLASEDAAGCCAKRLSKSSRTAQNDVNLRILEPHPEGRLKGSHRIRRRRQPELRITEAGIPAGESDMVERVGG